MNNSKLIIKFSFFTQTSNKFESTDENPTGAIFHRYLPNGENDAVSKLTDDYKIDLWFERNGKIGDFKLLEYDPIEKIPDESIIYRQGWLDSGYLFGKIECYDIFDKDLTELYEDKIQPDKYLKIGKKLVKLIEDHVSYFIDILKLEYGQYWIKSFQHWNSKTESLGHYFNWVLDATYYNPNNDNWIKFSPTNNVNPTQYFTVSINADYSNYISESEWSVIKNKFRNSKDYDDSLIILQKAHVSYNSEEYSIAFIEINTSVELTVKEFIRKKMKQSNNIQKYVEKFRNNSVIDQFIYICLINSVCSPEDLEKCIKVIKMRNDIIHEGKYLFDNIMTIEFYTLARVLIKIMGYDKILFPKFPNSNELPIKI